MAAAVIVLNWESISDDVAVHYGPGGEPDSFEQKSPVSVFNFMFGGIALSGLSVLSYAVCLVYLSSRGLIERFHKPIRVALLVLLYCLSIAFSMLALASAFEDLAFLSTFVLVGVIGVSVAIPIVVLVAVSYTQDAT